MVPKHVDYTGDDHAVDFLDEADPPGRRDYFSCHQIHRLATDINKRYRLPDNAPVWIGDGIDDADLSKHTWAWWVQDIRRTARRTPDKDFCLVGADDIIPVDYLAVVRVGSVVGVVMVGDCGAVIADD